MSYTIEKALADAEALVERLRDHDDAAESHRADHCPQQASGSSEAELRTSLEEHQSALELIMSKYREQMFRLLMASKKDDPGIIMKLKDQHSKELQACVDQITEMAAIMRKAIETDEQQGCKEQERIVQLEQENKGLRDILQITRESPLNLRRMMPQRVHLCLPW